MHPVTVALANVELIIQKELIAQTLVGERRLVLFVIESTDNNADDRCN